MARRCVPAWAPEETRMASDDGGPAEPPGHTGRPNEAAAGFAALVAPHTQAMMHVAAALVGLADAEDAAPGGADAGLAGVVHAA
jgi:hypothetical protein